jgi:hypothetical protein
MKRIQRMLSVFTLAAVAIAAAAKMEMHTSSM